ncbi:MAG: iron ABC transporter permease [gamma proteobacterium symbiont of Lucinoma myriamae]|nr:iron ABC transporter permease [gamma proteobacterium symbiont of Lucinoma myriamae]MCU7818900.1 iron ABC transporter permease [gamma proteobacterium symbiont of Lucinoma myriamae]MCU7832727.1 iron ABC transporter permease [gamma proteobacterium symbiont of Lucinoma myriamae]
MKLTQHPLIFLSGLMFLLLISFIFALLTGSGNLSTQELLALLNGTASPLHQSLIFELRLPRALAAFAAGALLSIAGVLMQVLLRNPLADPYVLGVSGGSALAALLAMLMGFNTLWLTGSAFLGALLSIFLVFSFANNKGSWTISRLLLTGIILASGWGALISFVLVISPPEKIHGMLFWLMGDLSYDRPLLPSYLILLIGFLFTMSISRQLNILLWGELQAGSLGVDSKRLRGYIFLLSSMLTAGAITLAGSIGFVGLVIPHLVRLLIGTDHRLLLPASALLGGSILIIADTLARTLLAPQQLPVGVLTALIGVPLFLYLLRRSH